MINQYHHNSLGDLWMDLVLKRGVLVLHPVQGLLECERQCARRQLRGQLKQKKRGIYWLLVSFCFIGNQLFHVVPYDL
jgi:hypothetical protein